MIVTKDASQDCIPPGWQSHNTSVRGSSSSLPAAAASGGSVKIVISIISVVINGAVVELGAII